MNTSVISKLSGLIENEDFLEELANADLDMSEDLHSTGGSDEQIYGEEEAEEYE